MKNYTWKVTNLYTIDTDTETDYVVDAIYEVVGTEESGGETYTSSLIGTATFEVVQGDSFTPYADLTDAMVVGWVKEELGADGVSNYEASVGGMIDSEITPPVSPENTPLPW